ncbi:hypothetical protein ABZ128_27765 [Streptomyces sp. NPDC006326]|uniref:hypothetical protein n=1 Tax=Streptomyces sp. NPDC006326 TaxID=3156752 RepID=UPI0033AEC605
MVVWTLMAIASRAARKASAVAADGLDRSITPTSPSIAYGAVPGAVSRPTDAPNSPAVKAASASASASVDQPDNWSSPSARRPEPGAGHRAGTGT